MFRTAANGANWNPSVIHVLRHHCYGMKNRLHETTIHLRSHRANMSHRRCRAMSIHRRRCCAILSLNLDMIRASRCAAVADCIWAHCVEPADCNAARSVARAMNCPAALWA